jgi:hypothetical protein
MRSRRGAVLSIAVVIGKGSFHPVRRLPGPKVSRLYSDERAARKKEGR